MSIGIKIYELRTAKNLSQGDLAEMLDVSRQSVSKWETDAAVPELDKLIKLCDVFGVTLDELAERTPPRDSVPAVTVIERSSAFTPQNAVGCILLAAGLIFGILLFLLSGDIEEILYTGLLIVTPLLVCGIICLCLKTNAGYWCVWSAVAPVTILTPNIIGLPILSGIGIFQIVFFTVMQIYAVKRLRYPNFKLKISNPLPLAIAWIVCASAYAVTLFVFNPGVFPLFIINFAVYSALALLITYTGLYVQIKKIKKED